MQQEPAAIPIQELGEQTNLEVLQQRLPLKDRDVVDIGCGDLTFSRILAESGAQVLAIDPDPVQAEQNRQHPVSGIRFEEAGGDAIPADDQSLDGACFSYSLHHIPTAIHPEVFAELRRVLRPDGFVYVIEPLDCPLNQVMRHFHDEDLPRKMAWETAVRWASHFRQADAFRYHGYVTYPSFAAYADHFASRSFNTLYSAEDVWHERVQQEFERQRGPDGLFQTPRRVMHLQGILNAESR